MTEREKMLQGLPYNSRDPELIALYWRAKEIMHDFNASRPNIERMKHFHQLVPQCGEQVWVEPPFFCEYGSHIRIGKGSYININCFFQDCGLITVGNHALIGPGVQFCTATHPTDSRERIRTDEHSGESSYITSTAPISIGHRVWIGANATILGGVVIGDDCVIGAGSVVTRSIPAGSIAHGVPCRVVRSSKNAKDV